MAVFRPEFEPAALLGLKRGISRAQELPVPDQFRGIAAAIEQGRVVLRVGNPKQEGASEHQGNRMALDNIRHRLEALHGPSVSVSARSQQQHYEIEISYPLQ